MNISKIILYIGEYSRAKFIDELLAYTGFVSDKNVYNKLDEAHKTELSQHEKDFLSNKVCDFVINVVSKLSKTLSKNSKKELLKKIMVILK